MTKQINISELKVGDKLPDYTGVYGSYLNREIAEIKKTKGGRFNIKISQQWQSKAGEIEVAKTTSYSNGALSGNTVIIIKS